MTLLSAIPRHLLYVTCRRCGHVGQIVLRDLAERYPDRTVHDVAAAARCAQCGAVGHTDLRIVWAGAK